MSQRSTRTALLALAAVLVCLAVLACGSDTGTEPGGESDQPAAAITQESVAAVEEPTGSVEDVPSQPAPESFSIRAAEALAPISILSSAEFPDDTEDFPYMQLEVDQAGSVHILIHWGWSDTEEEEIYRVGGVVYARDSEPEFAEVDDPGVLELLATPFDLFSVREDIGDLVDRFPLHGVLWAAAYETVEAVGTETVQGFSTVEYRLVIDAEALLDHSAVWEDVDEVYEAILFARDNAIVHIWVEETSGAIVKAEWRVVSESGGETETAFFGLEVTPLGDIVFELPPVGVQP